MALTFDYQSPEITNSAGDGIVSIPVVVGGNKYIQVIAVEKATAIADGTDIIGAIEIPFDGTITSMRAKTISGTCTVTVKKGGASLGTIAATATGVNTAVTSSVTAFDDITFDVSSASGSGLVITLTVDL